MPKTPKKNFEQYQDFLSRLFDVEASMEGLEKKVPKKDNELAYMSKTITFQLTDACNLCCSYCYQINKGKRVMSFETAKEFVDLLIKESYDPESYVYIENTPAIIVEFIGGEPLLETKLMTDIIDYVRYRLIQEHHPWAQYVLFSLISNGVRYFEDDVQKMIQKNNNRLSFGISLDGCKELHDMCRVFPDGVTGSYDLAVAGCEHYMKNYNPEMLTKMTIAPENVTWIFKAIKNLISLGYESIHCNCVYEEGWTVDHATILYNEFKKVSDYLIENDLHNDIFISMLNDENGTPLKETENKNYCGSTGCMLACDPDGVICPCIRFMKSSLGEELGDFSLGDVKHGIGKLPEHKERINILDNISRRSQSTDECWNCPIASGCGWCTAHNYQATGNPDIRCTYICWMHRARSLACVYHWNKVYEKNNEDIGEYFPMNLQEEYILQIITEKEYEMLKSLVKKRLGDDE